MSNYKKNKKRLKRRLPHAEFVLFHKSGGPMRDRRKRRQKEKQKNHINDGY